MTGSVLFYVQHLLGIGHLQRTLRIVEALAGRRRSTSPWSAAACRATLPVHPPLSRLVQLPPVRARDASFELIDAAGAPIDDALRRRRRAALLALSPRRVPTSVVIEGFPFARRAFRFELDPLIAAARAGRPRPALLCSVRDIVVMRDDPERRRAIGRTGARRLRRRAGAWRPGVGAVRGELSGRAGDRRPAGLYRLYRACAAAGTDSRAAAAGDQVIVSAGGGAAGHALLQAALAARRAGCLADSPWLLLAGSNLPEAEFDGLRRDAPAGVVIARFAPDLPALLRRCRVSVSQAGYNTVLDILAARARAVLVPFAAERETEQLLRAERLAALGAVEMVREDELSPSTLAAAIERAAAREPAPGRDRHRRRGALGPDHRRN